MTYTLYTKAKKELKRNKRRAIRKGCQNPSCHQGQGEEEGEEQGVGVGVGEGLVLGEEEADSVPRLYQCQRCKACIYCSKSCQREDFTAHNISCSNPWYLFPPLSTPPPHISVTCTPHILYNPPPLHPSYTLISPPISSYPPHIPSYPLLSTYILYNPVLYTHIPSYPLLYTHILYTPPTPSYTLISYTPLAF